MDTNWHQGKQKRNSKNGSTYTLSQHGKVIKASPHFKSHKSEIGNHPHDASSSKMEPTCQKFSLTSLVKDDGKIINRIVVDGDTRTSQVTTEVEKECNLNYSAYRFVVSVYCHFFIKCLPR